MSDDYIRAEARRRQPTNLEQACRCVNEAFAQRASNRALQPREKRPKPIEPDSGRLPTKPTAQSTKPYTPHAPHAPRTSNPYPLPSIPAHPCKQTPRHFQTTITTQTPIAPPPPPPPALPLTLPYPSMPDHPNRSLRHPARLLSLLHPQPASSLM